MTLVQLAGTLILQLGADDPMAAQLIKARDAGRLRMLRALMRSHIQGEMRRHEAALDALRVHLGALEAAELGRPEALGAARLVRP